MVFTFSIKKEHGILLEVAICEEIFSKEIIMPHLIQKCFERVFEIIEEEKRQKNEVVESEEENSSE